MMQLIRGPLDVLKVVAKRSYDCLFHDAGFLCHTVSGVFRSKFPVLAFWKLGAWESTSQPYQCAQSLLNSPRAPSPPSFPSLRLSSRAQRGICFSSLRRSSFRAKPELCGRVARTINPRRLRVPNTPGLRVRLLTLLSFLLVSRLPEPFNPPPLPFNPQFRLFTAKHLTTSVRRAILSRVYRIPSLPITPFLQSSVHSSKFRIP